MFKSLSRSSLILLSILALLSVPVQAAESCPRPLGRGCSPTTAPCSSEDVTSTTVRLGGEGSVGTEDSCSSAPARDAEGNVVEADVVFTWDRDLDDTRGVLTLLAINATCDPSISKITTIWFNSPAEIASCSLRSAWLTNPGDATPQNVCGDDSCTTKVSGKSWSLDTDANGEGCLGGFDWELDTKGVEKGVLPGGQIELELDCAGAGGLDLLTACDIAIAGSEGDVGDRIAQCAMHFQNTDPGEGELSNKISSNCQEDLYVDLVSLDVVPDDSEVALEWRTAMEVDNAGFRIFRRSLVGGEIEELTDGMIPAAGDINLGASYRFVDETAINGVAYEFMLVDVELSGLESQHPGVVAVANPPRSSIRLVTPVYGNSELRLGDVPRFAWESDGAAVQNLLISSDPTFTDRRKTLAIPGSRRNLEQDVELTRQQAQVMEQLALGNSGVLYWRVIQGPKGRGVQSSATHSLSYGVLDGGEDSEPPQGRGLGMGRRTRRNR